MRDHVVQWFVQIDRSFYEVTFLGAGQGWELLQVKGRNPGTSYSVQVSPDGTAVCNCPDRSRPDRPCKHARALQALGSIGLREERAAG